MTLKKLFQTLVGATIVLLVINSFLVTRLLSNQAELNKASAIQTETADMLSFYRMVNEITVRLIRQYAVTGDENAREQYDEVIDVVMGKRPWPSGKTLTAGAYMTYLGFPDRAFQLRDQAIDLAKPVYKAEDIAYNAMQGKYADSNGKYTVNGPVNQALAIEAVHSIEYQNIADKMQPVYEELMRVVADDKKQKVELLYQGSVNLGLFILVMAIITIVMVIFIFWIVNKRILIPLNGMVQLTESVASGQLTVASSSTGKDEVGRFGAALNRMVNSLAGFMGQVSTTANSVNTSALDLKHVVNETRHRAENQQRDTAQVASAITQMASASLVVANSSADTAKAGQQASVAAADGKTEVARAVEVINRLAEQIDDASNKVTELEQHASSVSNVLDVIKAIAEQTNLLALNAAIEAARAGEQGRGFAVVADEVRTLAQRTQASTNEIQVTIEQLLSGTSAAVKVMTTSRNVGVEAVKQAKSAGDSLESIDVAVAKIDSMAADIANSAAEQSTVLNQVEQLLVSINTVSEESLDSAVHSAESAQLLGNVSSELQSVLTQFTYE